MLASLGTALLVFWFTARCSRLQPAGFVAVLALFVAEPYIVSTMGVGLSSHSAARSGDYEALLTLWTTTYLIAGYLFLTPGTPEHRDPRWLAIGAVAVALAFMTKSVGGLAFVPALLVYATMTKQLRWLLVSRSAWVSAAIVALVVIGWYATREWLDPGYVDAALHNDVFGRALTAIDGHTGEPLFYVTGLGALSPGLLLQPSLPLRSSRWLDRHGPSPSHGC